MGIVVENVTKFYGTQKALDDLSFSIEKGEIIGFLGPNGAGKSTLMKILTGFIENYEGKISINGKELDIHKREIQQIIGYLPEHNPLYTEMYVREYLAFNANVYQTNRNRIEEVIQLTGLENEANKKIEQLSKGYRQRVGLANALLHDPEILILDEPTTGLDPNQLLQIRELIKKVGKEKTVFLSTHIMQEVEAICDRIIIIKKGNKVADLQTEELEKGKTLESIFIELTS
ncbi:gliding motility-associated ABC transporter ATP-binding subunit GldA [Mesonia sp. K7]|nr:gliding motility-associated ABC transporter ATP-binding subunit GldA [Mesonia sp. K7]